MQSILKPAFADARLTGDIGPALGAFLGARLFVVTIRMLSSEQPEFFIQKSPGGKQYCVTVSEDAKSLSGINGAELLDVSGRELLDMIGPEMEVVIVYGDGGDHLNVSQLAWLRENME